MGAESATFRVTDLRPAYTTVVDVTLRVENVGSEELAAFREAVVRSARRRFGVTTEPSIKSLDVVGEEADGDSLVAVHLRVPVIDTEGGWIHRTSILRNGEYFSVIGPAERIYGRVVGINSAVTEVR